MVQCLGLCASTAEGPRVPSLAGGGGGGSVGVGAMRTKIPQAPPRGQKKEGLSVSALILASETSVRL